MFNRHGLPKSLIESSNQVLKNTKDIILPKHLKEILEETSKDCLRCVTLEDKKDIIEYHINQVCDYSSLDQNTLVMFENAVDQKCEEMINEKAENRKNEMKKEKSSKKEDEKDESEEKDEKDEKDESEEKEESDKKEDDDKDEKETNSKSSFMKFIKAKKEKKDKKDINEKYQYFIDVISSLTEEEFDAYVDILNEKELSLLEQILDQTKTINE